MRDSHSHQIETAIEIPFLATSKNGNPLPNTKSHWIWWTLYDWKMKNLLLFQYISIKKFEARVTTGASAIHQSINQSINQKAPSHSINQSIHNLLLILLIVLIKQSINQLLSPVTFLDIPNQSINQSTEDTYRQLVPCCCARRVL